MAVARLSVLAAVLALAGCGGDAEPSSPAPGEPQQPAASAAVPPQCRQSIADAAAAALERPRADLRLSGEASLGIVSCDWRERSGREAYVGVSIDTAPQTARRYYDLISEARQIATFDATSGSLRPHNVPGVGNDATHGGVGAYWVPGRAQLNALAGGRLVKVTVSGDGLAGSEARAGAISIARSVLATPEDGEHGSGG